MKSMGNCFLVLLLAAGVMCCIGCQKKYCEPGAAQSCYCSDGTTAEQVCKEDGTAWEDCGCTNKYAYWDDPATNLTWQNPQKDAYTKDDGGVTQPDAIRYCEELVLGGHDDWRLPNIDELRTLLQGNPAAGDCPLTEGSQRDDMNNDACASVGEYGGPGSAGCYWGPDITGTCNKPDPAAVGHPLEYVSSTVAADNKDWVGDVLFDNGSICFNHIHSLAEARCVRTGPTTAVKCADSPAEACAPGETRQCTVVSQTSASDELTPTKVGVQTCAADGKCWGPCESTAFTPAPPITDICEQCDQVKLTIRVPEKLAVKAKQVMAFLYAPEKDGSWIFPPMRPPDGGTDYDQVIDPVIDVDTPLTMTVPGCTYYREKCLTGNYYLLVFLLNSEKMPPTPVEGEYAWGMVQEPMKLGDGPQKIIEKDIMLVSCGKDADANGTGDICETK